MKEKGTDEESDEHTAEYTLVPILQTPRVDPGNEIEIDLYVLGAGQIGDNRLDIIYGFSQLAGDEDFGEAKSAVAIDLDGDIRTGKEPIQDDLIKTSYELPTTGRRFSFAEELINCKKPDSKADFPPSALGRSHDGNPPLRLKIQTDKNAAPGDYELPLVFTYAANGLVNQDCRQVDIHVNSWVERHRHLKTIAIIISAIIALISLLASSGLLTWLMSVLPKLNSLGV